MLNLGHNHPELAKVDEVEELKKRVSRLEEALIDAYNLAPVGFGRCEGEQYGPFEVIGKVMNE